MSGSEIIYETLSVYNAISSYRDRVCVATRFARDYSTPHQVGEAFFTTAYVRPNRMRIESSIMLPDQRNVRRAILHIDCGTVQLWRAGIGRVNPLPMLFCALGSAGIAAKTIGGLLMPGHFGGSWLNDITEAMIINRAYTDARECYLLKCRGKWENEETTEEREIVETIERFAQDRLGLSPSNRDLVLYPTYLWIDCESFLVRRIEQQDSDGDQMSHTISVYNCESNVQIMESELQFDC